MSEPIDFLESKLNELANSIDNLSQKGKVFFEKNPLLTVTTAFVLGLGATLALHSKAAKKF